MTDFTARRPVIKSVIKLISAMVCGILLPVVFTVVYRAEPQDIASKILQCVYFSVFAVGELFALAFFLDGLRNLIAPPTVSVKGDSLKIFGYKPVNLSAVERVEMTDISKRSDKSVYAIAVYIKNEDEPRLIKRNFTGIPLDTVKYAIEVRLNKQ